MQASPLFGTTLDGSDFVVAEWVDDNESSARRPIAPLHVRHADDEALYVLQGELGFLSGGERHEVAAGAGVLAPRGRHFDSELLA